MVFICEQFANTSLRENTVYVDWYLSMCTFHAFDLRPEISRSSIQQVIGQYIRSSYVRLFFRVTYSVVVCGARSLSNISYDTFPRRAVLLPNKVPKHSTFPSLGHMFIPTMNRWSVWLVIALGEGHQSCF